MTCQVLTPCPTPLPTGIIFIAANVDKVRTISYLLDEDERGLIFLLAFFSWRVLVFVFFSTGFARTIFFGQSEACWMFCGQNDPPPSPHQVSNGPPLIRNTLGSRIDDALAYSHESGESQWKCFSDKLADCHRFFIWVRKYLDFPH